MTPSAADWEHLASHALAKSTIENLRPVLEESADELKKARAKKKVRTTARRALLPHEWYDVDVFTHVSALISGLERLQQAQTFIQTFPRPRTYERQGINQHTWIEYHYSYYVLTAVSLFDIALLLTNSVFRLGNLEQDCKPSVILENHWVSPTRVKPALKALEKLVRPHREARNLHVHRGTLPNIAGAIKSESLDRLKLISTAQTISGQTSKPLADRKMIEQAYADEVTAISGTLGKETGAFANAVRGIFDALRPCYEEMARKLRKEFETAVTKELSRRRKASGTGA